MAIKEKSWKDYELQKPLLQATETELRQAVKKAAKAANQRLLRRERAGRKSGVYKSAIANLERMGRRRFAESAAKLEKMNLNELRHEYDILRDWLSAKTSTLQGIRKADIARWHKAQERGFDGTLDEWIAASETYFTERAEALFSSDVIYTAITQGNVDIVQSIMERENKARDKLPDKGTLLIEYMRQSAARKRR